MLSDDLVVAERCRCDLLRASLDREVLLQCGDLRLPGIRILEQDVAGVSGQLRVFDLATGTRTDGDHSGGSDKIIGPRTVAQLESAVSALEIGLSADDLRALDEIFPGPGGQAPEAYAW